MSDVIIIGTGASASIVARHYAARGQKVLMLERGPDEPYAPTMRREKWHEATSEGMEDGRLINRNKWTGMPDDSAPTFAKTIYDDLAVIENVRKKFAFHYNMRLGYGGSSAVWSGRVWRFFDSDFSTRSSFGYGLDWPVSGEDMAPFYDAAEELLSVSGPSDGDWPFRSNFQHEAFAPTQLDLAVGEIFEDAFDFYPTANAVKRIHPLEGGCVAAKTCVDFCPSNALFRHYQMLDPLKESGAVTVQGDCIVSGLDVDTDGFVKSIFYTNRKGGKEAIKVERGQKVFLCANTIENLRILLNSEQMTGKKIANSSGLLGKYFGTHGAVVHELTAKKGLKIGHSRPSTSAGLTQDLGESRQQINAYMAELWNINFLRGSPPVAIQRRRDETGHWGRALFENARDLARKVPVSIIFEIEMRQTNQVRLSDAKDKWGIPAALVDFQLSKRDEATFAHINTVFSQVAKHEDCQSLVPRGYGINGNHPLGGYVSGHSASAAVTDKSGRAFGHPNLYLAGGGLFASTSAFNPTLTITANTLRCLSLIGDGA